jgi:hypothetical protein
MAKSADGHPPPPLTPNSVGGPVIVSTADGGHVILSQAELAAFPPTSVNGPPPPHTTVTAGGSDPYGPEFFSEGRAYTGSEPFRYFFSVF